MKKTLLLLCLLAVLPACSTLSQNDDISAQHINDPLHGFNKAMYKFNETADKYVARPVAKGYDKVVPKPVKSGVNNFFSNLGEPLNIANNLLQGKVDGTLKSTYRFVVNSTVGVLGLFDVAGKLDVEKQPEDLGQTLAVWGVKPGPYLVLPFFGPSNFRDGFGLVGQSVAYSPYNEISDTTSTQVGLYVLNAVNIRVKLLGADQVLDKQLNPYSFMKTAYQEQRINAIYDNNPPEKVVEDYDDF